MVSGKSICENPSTYLFRFGAIENASLLTLQVNFLKLEKVLIFLKMQILLNFI